MIDSSSLQALDTKLIKANRVMCGNNIIDMTQPNRIQFNHISGQGSWINPATGQNDFIMDLSQLENITIKHLTINNLSSQVVNADVGNFKNLNQKWDDDDIIVNARFQALENKDIDLQSQTNQLKQTDISLQTQIDNIISKPTDLSNVYNILGTNIIPIVDPTFPQQNVYTELKNLYLKLTDITNIISKTNQDTKMIYPFLNDLQKYCDDLESSKATKESMTAAIATVSALIAALQTQCGLLEAKVFTKITGTQAGYEAMEAATVVNTEQNISNKLAIAAAVVSLAEIQANLVTLDVLISKKVDQSEFDKFIKTDSETNTIQLQTTMNSNFNITAPNIYDNANIDLKLNTKQDLITNTMDITMNNLTSNNTYNKSQVDSLVSSKQDILTSTSNLTINNLASVNTYNKSEVDNLNNSKQNLITNLTDLIVNTLTASNIYNKTQVDSFISSKQNVITPTSDLTIGNLYAQNTFNKDQIYQMEALKQDKIVDSSSIKCSYVNVIQDITTNNLYAANTYTKKEVDDKITGIGSSDLLARIQNLETFQSQQQTWNDNIGSQVSALNIDNNKNKIAIANLQTNYSNLLAALNAFSTRLNNVETSLADLKTMLNGLIVIENYYADNYSMTFCGIITIKWGNVDVGGALGKKIVTFATPFKMCGYSGFVSVICDSNSGGGADVGYSTIPTTTSITITSDYANSGGNKSNKYSWLAFGW
ncbi:Hypothetical_protein [Hexamita inflata]|uniref:Hypothetical_protein n=1 Tax=Hexamita inflata TaxID=28002 RepID=A0AA86QAF6_9EUKA|nr:Hypothetical protein HINF_LOCUS40062 [Hexamita inflata]